MPTTTRGLRYPAGTDTPDVVRDITNLANDIDAMFVQGTIAARPSFGKIGREYYATDTGAVYLDTGTAWIIKGYNDVARLSGTNTWSAPQRFSSDPNTDIQIWPGSATNPGYLAWHNTSGQRIAYMGFDNPQVTFQSENGGYLRVVASSTSIATEQFAMTVGGTVNYNGSPSTHRQLFVQNPTLVGVASARTVTTAATLAVEGTPAAGTNMTITVPLALWVQSGMSRFDGTVRIGANTRAAFVASDSSNLWNIDNNAGGLRFFREDYAAGGAGANAAVRAILDNTGNLTLYNGNYFVSSGAYASGAGASGLALNAANAQQRFAADNTGISFFGAATAGQRNGYGSNGATGSYTALGAASKLDDVIAALTKLIADLRTYGLIGA